MQTISMTAIMERIISQLQADESINQFCIDHYGVKPTFFYGMQLQKPPPDDICPWILLLPGTKEEGPQQFPFNYLTHVSWCIKNESDPVPDTTNDGIYRLPGLVEVDQLGQLIQAAVTNLNAQYPAKSIHYDIEGTAEVLFPLFPGYMAVEFEVTPAIGGSLVF